ncbi:MAG: DUF362 domain-containing protein [Clostridium sp.]|jgi:uncharacterized Fe-S center protein|uniref:DUF362 domain-containing protein n=1 Tax=Clostridium sp. TaxID=1506 RepID=UPI0025B9EFF5|nr:DUF362 domain-containing protein [Clostridium sp.]MCH3964428.1 DUF362 domain-containing protein [Clostridium sp.]MCI1715603.1 DUF362 domain-containing protein [Clostridium sp.]MCI1799605.1 DUF362 domain-containing protein [Clostridium sp.]MCI1813787.1 DUF362 domain-containing protein [Clostridium sp.]MCI1870418.1 DUF362 domain-containing protein [Clostridium sp.]
MKSDVYFANLRARSKKQNKVNKIRKLFERAGFKGLLNRGDLTAVKIHFGELGSDGYINPVFVRQVVDKIKESNAKPFLTDSNTLYSGSRANAVDHANTAALHGFNHSVVDAPVIIADGLKGENVKEVHIGKKHFKNTRIAGAIAEADSMIVMSHFKGHEMAGFGGAIKNLAMGCANPRGKKDQHSVRPGVNTDKCIGCGKCSEVCPKAAIAMEDKKSSIDKMKCVGCGECMTVCPVKAIESGGEMESKIFTEKLTEYAYGAVMGKEDKVGYINFVINVTPDCDCVPWSDTPIVPDIGILASKDPVALDTACYDLVNNAAALANTMLCDGHDHEDCSDKFKNLRGNTYGYVQLSYGEEIGLGTRNYNLIEI